MAYITTNICYQLAGKDNKPLLSFCEDVFVILLIETVALQVLQCLHEVNSLFNRFIAFPGSSIHKPNHFQGIRYLINFL